MAIDPAILASFTPPAPPQPVSVLLVTVPPGTPPRVQGEVVNIDQKTGQVTIKIPQGTVVIQTDIVSLQIGQKVDIRLPVAAQSGGQAAIIPYPAVVQNTQSLPSVPTPLPPPVTVDVAPPLSTTPPAPISYQTPVVNAAAAQTITQLVGQNLPATIVRPDPVITGGFPSSPPSVVSPFLPLTNGGTPQVQVLFIGALSEAIQVLSQSLSAQNNGGTPSQSVASPPSNTPFLPAVNAAQNAAQTIPILAQLIGVTSQKLPIFQTAPFAPSLELQSIPAAPTNNGSTTPTTTIIPEGSKIILHTPITNTPPRASENNAPIAALLLKLPPVPISPAQSFALDSLPQLAPFLTQLLQDPSSVLPLALAAQAGAVIPRPGTPRFAMNMVMSILGLSSGDASQVLPRAVLDALKPDQRAQLHKELQNLGTLSRDTGAQNTEGARFNIPVEMGGQLYLWQMTLRHHDGQNRGGSGDAGAEYPTRFILDLYMSNMGSVQVDGLSFSQSRRLDLVLRTQMILGDSVQKMLREESFAVLERARLTGSIEFQSL